MRYQNWDVLLFPGDSRTPIQEYDTKCFVLEQNVGATGDAAADKHSSSFESMRLVPILTSFVASLERGAPFRISIHSWDKPKPSQLLRSYKTPDELTMFEARVYMDGILVAHRTFDNDVWPEVIGDLGWSFTTFAAIFNANQADRDGQYLRFPRFHREILQQPDWEPGELMGRIKVVLAEGVVRANTPPAPSTGRFDRLRDVVAFSFQHAPQDILEYSQVAWPNTKMFADMNKRAPRPAPIGTRISGISGHEAHSHSPQRLPPIASRSSELSANARYQKVLDSQYFATLQSDPVASGSGPGVLKGTSSEHPIVGRALLHEDDPFVSSSHQSPAAIQQWRSMLRSTSHDISMPDYVSSKSAVNTEMSGVSMARANFERQVNEANPKEIVDALSPVRREQLLQVLSASNSPSTTLGTRPPMNTPQTDPDTSSNAMLDPAGMSGKTGDASHAKLWQEPRQRPRTSSASTSARSNSATSIDQCKGNDSPRKPRELGAGAGGKQRLVLPVAPRSQSLRVTRQRAASSGAKRKRRSASPLIEIEKQDTIRVVMATPSRSAMDVSGAEERQVISNASPGTPSSSIKK
ncbi:hypothetical protein H2200_006781 [Cladophialophora chaetospira]|uniref:Uncharacterized protein n=1 Tax=Cladophialophora chaetospira TaxID=386627 RepID=A0AA38X902_9EURO|nr:hypothetical protein H2200_006781 [Cladophialophora chaetospira]